jgi:hypothetical protein
MIEPKEYPLITSVAREQTESLPSLIEDARANALLVFRALPAYNIFVKGAAFPYTPRHMLVVPDKERDAAGIIDLPDSLGYQALVVASKIAEFYLKQPEVRYVDLGYNYSPDEPVKVIASQRKNFHIHVIAYTDEDLANRISRDEARSRLDLRLQLPDPAAYAVDEILTTQVLVPLTEDRNFRWLFEPTSQNTTFDFKEGTLGFQHPWLPYLLRELHQRGAMAYQEIASCYLERSANSNSFIDSLDGRYQLLPEEERILEVNRYLVANPDFPTYVQDFLSYLAVHIKSLSQLTAQKEKSLNRALTTEESGQLLLSSAAIRGFAYACVFSGIKTNSGLQWKFGFDPAVFSTRDVLQASRAQTKLYQLDIGKKYDADTLKQVQATERNLVQSLIG